MTEKRTGKEIESEPVTGTGWCPLCTLGHLEMSTCCSALGTGLTLQHLGWTGVAGWRTQESFLEEKEILTLRQIVQHSNYCYVNNNIH